MKFLTISTLFASFATILAHVAKPSHHCLSDADANDIATRWLAIWGTGAITSESQLKTIVTDDIASYDEAFGGPTLSLAELFSILTIPGPKTTTDVKQFPLQVLHDCEWITTRWEYTGITTGYNS
jgi:hypothetical protein